MSDLINREKLMNSIITRVCTGCQGDDCDDCKVVDCLQAVIDAPDDVTHCRECMYWMPCTAKGYEEHNICGLSGYLIGENGYCLYGTRKDDGNEN